jgi:hypothetical protein
MKVVLEMNESQPTNVVEAENYTSNKHKSRTSTQSAGFDHAISAIKRLQTYAYPQGRKIYLT